MVLVRVGHRASRDQIGLLAAGVAFYALLAVFPAIGALIALAGLFTNAGAVVGQLQSFAQLLPDDAAKILLTQAQLVAGAPEDGLSLAFFFGVGLAIYLLTSATTGLIHGLNVSFEIIENRGFFHLLAVRVLLTVSLLFGGVLLLVLLIGLPAALALVPTELPTERLLRSARWGIVALVFAGGIAELYRWGPSPRARDRWISPGVLTTGFLWFATSLAFSAYVENFGNYNGTFGSLGGVIVLLTWLWLSAEILFLGALLDSEVDRARRSGARMSPEREETV